MSTLIDIETVATQGLRRLILGPTPCCWLFTLHWKAERWTETGEGMEIYTGLDIVRGRAEDRRSETGQA